MSAEEIEIGDDRRAAKTDTMQSFTASQCSMCSWFLGINDESRLYCSAYLGGVPNKVRLNLVDHREAQPGDNGIRWDPRGLWVGTWTDPFSTGGAKINERESWEHESHELQQLEEHEG